MPHLHLESFQTPIFPARQGDVTFDFIARNKERGDESLIAARYRDKNFFLLHKKSETKELLKSDKVTRPSPNFLIKHALLAYAQCAGITITASNVDNGSENTHLQKQEALKTIDFFANTFPSGREIRIEVGFGSARHLLHQAAANPEVLFIGLEIHKPSIEQALKQITIQNLTNVMVLDYDARLFLEFVPSNVVGKIYVHFPVPWDKKPHRRVISPAFLEEAERALMVGGTLELRTDSEEYYRFALETFSAPQKSRFAVFKNRDIAISSKYEDRWKRMEKNIYDVIYTCDNENHEPAAEITFEFSPQPITDDTVDSISRETYKREWGFLHIERRYEIDGGGRLLRLAMGSFDRPENTYVIIQDGNARYFPTFPVRSRANLHAHILLDELLHG
ncbi:MAG: tRNA (guanosine(46)-N7)-methyltransferase TrmB [Sulfuricurvum sp.]